MLTRWLQMKNFKRTAEFDKEYKKLKERFRSLDSDVVDFEGFISKYPTGAGSKFVVIHDAGDCKIVKARLMCRALRKSSLRIIYAWKNQSFTFVYIEIYFKGDKPNEDRERIKEFLKTLE